MNKHEFWIWRSKCLQYSIAKQISSKPKNNEEEGRIIFIAQIKLSKIYWISIQLQLRLEIVQCANEDYLS